MAECKLDPTMFQEENWYAKANFQPYEPNTFQSETYRYDPTADVFIQDDFSPNENEHTAIPERLSLWTRRSV